MALQHDLPLTISPGQRAGTRRFLVLFLPDWPTDYLKRGDPSLKGPLVLHERIKGGLRVAAADLEAARLGIRQGQNLADARAMVPDLVVRPMDRAQLTAGFADFADWHSNASPLVAVLEGEQGFGDLVLDITGVAHLFGGEGPMLRLLLTRLRVLGYRVAGAIAPSIGAAWGVSHFARSQVVARADLETVLDALPVEALRLNSVQIAGLGQMGLKTAGALRTRTRKGLQARFGPLLLTRLDQAYGLIEERMTPRLPPAERHSERRFAEPIGRMDDVLETVRELAMALGRVLEAEGEGAREFHLFLYRVDHKVMTLSVRSARLTRDPSHIAKLFAHRAERLEGEYDAGFGIDMIRLAAGAVGALDAVQLGAFAVHDHEEDLDRLNDRMSSRLGPGAVLRTQMVASHLPERAARLVPAQAGISPVPRDESRPLPLRPLRLLPMPERVSINAEVPDGLPASMLWRGARYRIEKAAGPERLGAEWWRSGQRLELVWPKEEKEDAGRGTDEPKYPDSHSPILDHPPQEGERGRQHQGKNREAPKPQKKLALKKDEKPYVPRLSLFEPEAATRDYYVVEDREGCRFWVYRQGMHRQDAPAVWYLHGLFA